MKRLRSLDAGRWLGWRIDVVVALLLTGSSIGAVLIAGVRGGFGTPPWPAVALALVSTAPVALRGRWPVHVAAVILVANALCAWAAAPQSGALQPFIALTLAFYSVGSHVGRAQSVRTVITLAVAALPLFAAVVALRESDPGNAAANYVWLFAAWAVGLVVQDGRSKNQQLAEANRLLLAQQELQTRAAIAVERGRIAREVHDIVAHNISMMVVQAGAAGQVLQHDEPRVRDALDAIAATGREVVDEMRRLLGMLRSVGEDHELGPQPGLGDLDALVLAFQRAGLPVEVRRHGRSPRLRSGVDLTAYRIVQEALTNAFKHGGRRRVTVELRFSVDRLWITVVDDAGPKRPASSGTGLGLIGMQERAALYGGSVSTEHDTAGAFVVGVELPLGNEVSA